MKTRKLLTIAFAALSTIAFLVGCKDDNVGITGKCPVVSSTDPANAASGVPLDKVVTVTFNTAMNPATIVPGVLTVLSPGSPGGRVAGTSGIQMEGSLTYNATNYTMSFTPRTKFAPNATYTGTVSSSAKDATGNAMQADYIWTFSTGTFVSPAVTATDPLNNATGVFLNKSITATFSVPMNSSTITTTTFLVKQGTTPVSGTVTYTGSTATFAPSAPLVGNTVYTATVTSGAKSATGAAILNDFTWSFTTGTFAGPSVNSTDPTNLASGVPLNKVVSATFSQAMDPLTITNLTYTLKLGATTVSGTVNYSGLIATFTPAPPGLLSGNTYTATITTGAKNTGGVALASNYVWTFNTNAPLGPPVLDLGSVARFGIIAGVGVSNNAGFSFINNLDVGIYPGARSSITGFPPAVVVNGAIYASDDIAPPGVAAMLLQAQNDLTAVYNAAKNATLPAPQVAPPDLGGKTLAPGIYTSSSTLLLQNGNLTLDAQGDANATWIFQVGSAFTSVGTGPYPSPSGGNVILAGGAQAKNVFWQVSSSATIGDYTDFKGNVLTFSNITLNSGAVATGRMLARNGSVVMTSSNTINKP